MKERPFSSANALASSVGTARRWRRSDLLPTNMMLGTVIVVVVRMQLDAERGKRSCEAYTMLESAWSLSSLSHLVTFS